MSVCSRRKERIMKKFARKNLKLQLHRETLQILENPEHLQEVAGGATLAGCATSARTCPVSNCCETFKVC
jgi:hypothetical protein